MFAYFEKLIDPTRLPADPTPPSRLFAFYWHYLRQAKGPLAALLVLGAIVGASDILMPVFFGMLVDILGRAEPETLLADYGWTFFWMAFVVLVFRPFIHSLHNLVEDQGVVVTLTNLVRWQTHWYVLRQSWGYFQEDFAGRIANKILQTSASLRESALSIIGVVWYAAIYALSTLILFASTSLILTIPTLIWFAAYAAILWYWVPRIQESSMVMSEARSALSGRIVDSYTNIQTVKLFARKDHEDGYVREALDDHTVKFQVLMRRITIMNTMHWIINAMLITGTASLAVYLWMQGQATPGTIATVLTLVWQIANLSGWIMEVVTNIFENFGTVEEGMETIARPHTVTDKPDARPLRVTDGRIRFDGITFHYGKQGGVIDCLDLDIEPGQKVGLVGRSGAGKSTLVNVLLRFFDLEGGRILIDGQDIANVTQDSLRSQIAMVTQDTPLLHRSILDNIRYGKPDASFDDVVAAAKRAQAHDFVLDLRDMKGREGYYTHVGERGVKLSGGQRQRIALARVILKDAPILILDEATSALDSEVEAAIQEQLAGLMEGKTVIAIAHRLSTIQKMDRLVIMDHGAVIEDGTHDALLEEGGHYAMLWKMQSGGFLAAE